MFLALQFPFVDLREFLEEESGRLTRNADVSSCIAGEDFIRSSGDITYRRKKGVSEWAGEELYCRSKLALRFPNRLGEMQSVSGSVKATVVNTFRRFYSTGPVARLEVALQLDVQSESFNKVSALEWVGLLRDILHIPMHKRNLSRKNPSDSMQAIQSKKASKTVELIHARKDIAQHYLAATTNRKLEPPVKPQPWWYVPGTPALVIEVKEGCSLPMVFPHTRHVLDVPEASASIYHARLEFDKKQSCSAWFMVMGDGDPDAVRRLRINLTRLHAERECLHRVLANIQTSNTGRIKIGDSFPQLDAINSYINKALKSIQKPKQFGIDRRSMFEVAHDAFGIALEGHEATLQGLGWQLAENVKNYIRRAENKAKIITVINEGDMITNIQMGNVTVSGDFNLVTARNIENSFNKVEKSEVNSDLKEKLKLLTIEVANLAKQLPSDIAEEVTRDLKTLTEESISPKPRKKWYELSFSGILEAAKYVASMIEPITTSVTAVRAALAIL